MTLDQTKAALEVQQQAFQDKVTQPNTLERNLVLAGYRTEIGRLEKVISISTQKLVVATANPVKPHNHSTPAE